ncbi:MAG: polymerase sigma factor FliA [Micromonosporaceae bacterium]
MTTANAADRAIEDLVRSHMALVGHLVREIASRLPAHVNRDDLTSAGLAALVTAARSYDPAREVPFARFATVRIRGALLDELRGMDWASRAVRHRARRVDAAREQLTALLGRAPSATELAEALGVAADEIGAIEDDVHRAVVLSLQGFTAGAAEEMVADQVAGPEDLLLHRERIGYLYNAVEALPERLRLVVTRYFMEERPMTEIAAELGVTESRVSQLRAEALTLLRDGLNSQLNPGAIAPATRPDGCVARRRASYFADIAAHGDLHSRLSMTSINGLPVRASA